MLANAKKALRSGLYADGYNFNDDKLVWLYIIKRFLILIFFFFRDWDQVVTHEQIEWGEESNAINKEQRICHLWEIECGAKWKRSLEMWHLMENYFLFGCYICGVSDKDALHIRSKFIRWFGLCKRHFLSMTTQTTHTQRHTGVPINERRQQAGA